MPRISGDLFIDLHDFDFLNNKPSFSIIDNVIAEKNEIVLCPVVDKKDAASNLISKRLRNLKRYEHFISEESGARDLYVGWPILRGKLHDNTLIRCPLLFLPVSLEEDEGTWFLKPKKDVNVSLNKAFLLAYAHYNQIKIDDELLEFNFDDIEKDSRGFRTSLYKIFKDHPVSFDFNQENFVDKLLAFKNFTKSEFEENTATGALKLYPEAVLGLFPQSDSFLIPDYKELIENNDFEDIEGFFYARTHLEEGNDPEKDEHPVQNVGMAYLDKVKEEQTFTPYKIDAYQENAIKAVKKGNSLVIQGPPGSGKSELICNLMADFIARGKKVLLVCQKKAALDVVHKRLEEKELGSFSALVHDFKNDRKAVYHQIDRQINRLNEYKNQNNSLDAIQLERNFLHSSRRIDQISEELNEFRFALFDSSECGISIKELYLTTDIKAPTINLKQEYQFFKQADLDVFLRKLKVYTSYSSIFEKEGYPWKDRKSFANLSISDFNKIQDFLEDIPKFKEKIHEQSIKVLDFPISLEEAELITGKENQIREMLLLLETEKVYHYFRNMVDFPDKETEALWLSNIERVIMGCFSDFGVETTIPSEQLGYYQEIIQKGIEAQKNPIKNLLWKYVNKEYEILKQVLEANQLQYSKVDFEILIKKIDNRLNLEHNIEKIKNNKWVTGLPESLDKLHFQTFFYHHKRALIAKMIFKSVRNFKEYFNVKAIEYDELNIKLTSLLFLIKQVPINKVDWQAFLTAHQIQLIQEDAVYVERLVKTLQTDFDSLVEFDNLKEQLSFHEQQIIDKLSTKSKSLKDDSLPALFLNSIKMEWISHIEAKYPILRSVSSQKFQLLEEELQGQVLEKMQASKDIVLMKAKERTYKDVVYNRLNNMVTYRELQHQVSKKKRIWPLRKLVKETSEDLFSLIPCWLASPETVSAIFPMQPLFDLVIFDEASQCYAEKGIPAMYRGKQVVVTGDDKQLSPSDLYRVRWEEDDEAPELVIDSLLDLCKQHLMQLQLQGHYRSRALDLIHFSNQHFYDDKLKMLPDFKDVNEGDPALRYIKVEGSWIDNKNDEEAQRVVALLRELISAKPNSEIGVVTFNARQQLHITELLEQEARVHQFKIPETLFIKNIENVQGDEKDIIIFSTAYAPDSKGRMIMNFGPLNAEGGENRLNVAITRAKETIYIVSSIYPQQLKVEESKNEGPKLLKKYLQFAMEVSEGRYCYEPVQATSFNVDWYLKNKLSLLNGNFAIGSQLVEEMPFADLSIKKNNKYWGLILTDDDHYYQGISIKELHVYKLLHLRQKNWKYKTFFSREYWQNAEEVKDLTLRFINQTESNA